MTSARARQRADGSARSTRAVARHESPRVAECAESAGGGASVPAACAESPASSFHRRPPAPAECSSVLHDAKPGLAHRRPPARAEYSPALTLSPARPIGAAELGHRLARAAVLLRRLGRPAGPTQVCTTLLGACCMLHVARCALQAAGFMLRDLCCLLHVAYCMLHAARFMMHGARCMLHVVCCV